MCGRANRYVGGIVCDGLFAGICDGVRGEGSLIFLVMLADYFASCFGGRD